MNISWRFPYRGLEFSPAEIVSIKRSRTDSKCFQFDLFSVRKIAITSEWGKNEAKNALFIEIKISNNLNKAYLVLEESTGNAKGNNSAAIQCHSAHYCNKRGQFSLCLYPRSSSLFLH